MAVTEKNHLAVLPEIAPMSEFVPDYDGSGWLAIGAPKGTADPAFKSRAIGIGMQPVQMTVSELDKLIETATEKWTKVVRFAGIKAE